MHTVIVYRMPYRDGCRPYVEVYQGEDRVLSTLQEYERMRLFNITEGKVSYVCMFSGRECPVDLSVCLLKHNVKLTDPAGNVPLQKGYKQGIVSLLVSDTVDAIIAWA
jgi:hypothetical protein